MMPRRILRLLIVLCCAHLTAPAQQDSNGYLVNIRRLTADDGLASEVVLCGLQDRQGFIWLGAREGLQRYDGQEFKLITKEHGGLQGSRINHLALAADGRIWITYGGARYRDAGQVIDVLDPITGKVWPFEKAFGSTHPPIGQQDIFLCLADETGNIFILTRGSDVWLYRQGTFRKIYDRQQGQLQTNDISWHKAGGGVLWTASADLRAIGIDTNGNVSFVGYPGNYSSKPFAAYSGGRALLWIRNDKPGPWQGRPLLISANTSGALRPALFDPYQSVLTSYYQDYELSDHADVRTGGLCYQYRPSGICLLRSEGSPIISLLDSARVASLGNPVLADYFTDASGRHWLCTDRGLFLIEVWKNAFHAHLDKTQLASQLPTATQIRGICQRPGDHTVLAAAWEGIYEFSDTGRPIRRVLEAKTPTFIYPDGAHLWTGTRTLLVDLAAQAPTANIVDRSGVADEQLWALRRARNGRLYAGGIHGVYDITTLPWRRLSGSPKGQGWCHQLLESHDGQLWAATNDGLLAISGSRIAHRYAADAPDTAHRLPCTDVHYIHEDRKGDFWLCTSGDGLVHWQRATGATRRYTTDDGLPTNVLHALLEDPAGYYWISSDRGLLRFDPRNGQVRTYTTKDGLPDNEFNRLSYYRAPGGRFYFGGINGLVAFDPAELNADPRVSYQAPMRVTALYVQTTNADRPLDQPTAGLGATGITFGPGQEYYSLHFGLLDYDARRHHYAYRIEGLDKRWIYIDETSLRLGNLPYGDYVLRIRGQGAWGEWSMHELAIPLHVMRPWYYRAWFLTLAAAALLLLVVGVIRWRGRALRRTNTNLEQTVRQRTAQLAEMLREKDILMKEIHHRVKNNLQVISALLQMQGKRTADGQTKSALQESQNRVLSIAFIHQNLYQHHDLKTVEMRAFVAELAHHLESIYTLPGRSIVVAQDVDPLSLDIDIAVPLGLILNELLTNTYKYAFEGRSEGKITIALKSAVANACRLTYRDDGPGLPPGSTTAKSKTLGLTLVNDLCRQLDGSASYQAAPGFGLTLDFPCQA